MNKIRFFLISFLFMLLLSTTAEASWFDSWRFFQFWQATPQENASDIADHEHLIKANTQDIFQNELFIKANEARIDQQGQKIDTLTALPSGEQPKILYANGNAIGKILNYGTTLSLEFSESFEPVEVFADGTILKLPPLMLFSGLDCQGEAYVYADAPTPDYPVFGLKKSKGEIFGCDAPECSSSLYYLPPNDGKYYFVALWSYSQKGQCRNWSSTGESYYRKVIPNTPTTTGIQEYPFPAPLTFEGMETLELITP